MTNTAQKLPDEPKQDEQPKPYSKNYFNIWLYPSLFFGILTLNLLDTKPVELETVIIAGTIFIMFCLVYYSNLKKREPEIKVDEPIPDIPRITKVEKQETSPEPKKIGAYAFIWNGNLLWMGLFGFFALAPFFKEDEKSDWKNLYLFPLAFLIFLGIYLGDVGFYKIKPISNLIDKAEKIYIKAMGMLGYIIGYGIIAAILIGLGTLVFGVIGSLSVTTLLTIIILILLLK